MATTQIDGSRQIKSGSISDAQIASGAAIASSKLADGANFVKKDGSVAFTADQSHGGNKITNLGTPVSSTDAANKGYVDAAAAGIDWKASVRAATTASGTLSSAYANGSVVDGVTLVTGDRILIKNQGTASENGIYTVNASGSPTRATDADSASEVTPGMAAFVEEGTVNADSGWLLTNNGAITLGTTSLVFVQFTGGTAYTAGAGLTLTGSTIDVVAADTSVTVNADSLQVRLGDASLEVASGLRVVHGTSGQVYIANASGVLTPVTLGGDVSAVSNTGAVTLGSTVQRTANFVDRETPSGSVNGSNTAFTLANTPIAGSEHVYLNGILQEPGAGNDYTISGSTITYLSAPLTGDKLRVTYRK